jgi:hypothetical protein
MIEQEFVQSMHGVLLVAVTAGRKRSEWMPRKARFSLENLLRTSMAKGKLAGE